MCSFWGVRKGCLGKPPPSNKVGEGSCWQEAALRLGRARMNCGFIGKIMKQTGRKENLDGQQGISEAGKLKDENFLISAAEMLSAKQDTAEWELTPPKIQRKAQLLAPLKPT